MAEHPARRRLGVNVVAVQRVPHALAIHVAPQGAQMFWLRVPEVADRVNAGACLSRSSIRAADAGNVSSGNAKSGSGISSGRQIVTPLGLSTLQAIFASRRLAANPIEQVICSPMFSRIRSLILFASPERIGDVCPVELASQLVDGLHRLNRNLAGDFIEQRVMRAAEQIGPLRDENDVGTDGARFRHGHDVLAAGGLGFLRAGDDDRGIRGGCLERNDADRPAPQMRHRLLHDGGEETVEIEIQLFDGLGFSHDVLSSMEAIRTKQEHKSQAKARHSAMVGHYVQSL